MQSSAVWSRFLWLLSRRFTFLWKKLLIHLLNTFIIISKGFYLDCTVIELVLFYHYVDLQNLVNLV